MGYLKRFELSQSYLKVIRVRAKQDALYDLFLGLLYLRLKNTTEKTIPRPTPATAKTTITRWVIASAN